MTARPRVSVVMPHAVRSTADELNAFARHAEDAGLDGVFTGDHLAAAAPLADSTLTLAVAAAATTRIALGFGVMVLALRHPAWAAKQVATLQQLSRNRVILGVGLGGAVHGAAAWDAVGVPYRDRAARTDASLAIMRGLIAGLRAARQAPWHEPAAIAFSDDGLAPQRGRTNVTFRGSAWRRRRHSFRFSGPARTLSAGGPLVAGTATAKPASQGPGKVVDVGLKQLWCPRRVLPCHSMRAAMPSRT